MACATLPVLAFIWNGSVLPQVMGSIAKSFPDSFRVTIRTRWAVVMLVLSYSISAKFWFHAQHVTSGFGEGASRWGVPNGLRVMGACTLLIPCAVQSVELGANQRSGARC